MYETCQPRRARRPHVGRGLEVRVMKRFPLIAAVLIAALGVLATGAAQAGGLERLYILNCGEGMAGDISRWSPGVNVGQSMPFVDNCYLLKHTQGGLPWDTGVPDAIASRGEPLHQTLVAMNYGNLPLRFEVNRGQIDNQVQFFHRGNQYTLFLTSTEAVLVSSLPHQAHILRLQLLGANPTPQITGVEELPGANTQGATLKEAKANLEEAINLVIETNRLLAEESLRGQKAIREQISISAA